MYWTHVTDITTMPKKPREYPQAKKAEIFIQVRTKVHCFTILSIAPRYTKEHCFVWRYPRLFYVLLTVHLGMMLVNNQLDAQFFMNVYFYSLHVSGSHVPIIRRIVVSMWHLVYISLCRWPSGMQVILHTGRSSAQTDINQVSHWYNNSPDDRHMAARKM